MAGFALRKDWCPKVKCKKKPPYVKVKTISLMFQKRDCQLDSSCKPIWIGKVEENVPLNGQSLFFGAESQHINPLNVDLQSQDSCDPPTAGTTILAVEVSACACCDLLCCVAMMCVCTRDGCFQLLI